MQNVVRAHPDIRKEDREREIDSVITISPLRFENLTTSLCYVQYRPICTFVLGFPRTNKMTRFLVLEHHLPVLEHPFMLQNIVFCFRTSFSCFSFCSVLFCPSPSLGKIFSLSLCPGTTKEFLSLCHKKLDGPIPLETLVSLESFHLQFSFNRLIFRWNFEHFFYSYRLAGK